jgi:hypothetical protein
MTKEEFADFVVRFMLHSRNCPYVSDPQAPCDCGAPTDTPKATDAA